MRRLALGLALLWLCAAYGFRIADMRKPQFRVAALTGGQRHQQATVAWLEGPVNDPSRGRMVVADLRTDGKLLRFASKPLRGPVGECRLWLEENPEWPAGTDRAALRLGEPLMQAVAACPGAAPQRLNGAGGSLSGLGPDDHPPTLYTLAPLHSLDPEKVLWRIHRHDVSPPHPLLWWLGLLAMVPLLHSATREWRRARRLQAAPLLSGVLEHTAAGVMTIRSGARRVAVYVEQGQVLSVGLRAGDLSGDAAMAVDGLKASVQGEVEAASDGVFRGGEALRLRRGAVVVVGDDVAEAQRRLRARALRDVAVAGVGVVVAAATAAGLLW